MNAADPTDPSNYRPHPYGYACVDCNASAKMGDRCRHTGLCDIAPKMRVLPSDQAQPASVSRAKPSLRAAVKRGDASLYYTDAEIVDAVRLGEVSMSDAMNQDC